MSRIVRAITGVAVDLFYRRRHLSGEVPPSGPLVLVANHPNALVDPVVLQRLAGRQVRLLGKAPLFEMPLVGWMARSLGMLPVYRARDGFDTAANDTTFRAVHDALARGDAVGIFPEGISHDEPELQPLKTGAARMALGAEAANDWTLGVQVVPVGLVYTEKETFRSEVATWVGEPLAVAGYRSRHESSPRDAVRALTADIDEALREVTLNTDRWEDLPLLETAERIWPESDDAREVRLHAFAEGVRKLRSTDAGRLAPVERRVAAFRDRLQRLGLRADRLDRAVLATDVLRFALRNLVGLLVGLPVALLAGLLWSPPYYAVRLVIDLARRSRDELATAKLLLSLLLFPAWLFVLAGAAALWWGALPALAAAFLLPPAGLHAERFWHHRAAAWREARAFVLFLRRRDLEDELRAERDLLRGELEALSSLLDDPASTTAE